MVRGESSVGDEFRDDVLTLVSGIDVCDLPIGPTEAFLLSRVEGPSSLADLVSATGLSVKSVKSIVDRLVALGALEFIARSKAPSRLPSLRPGMRSLPPTGPSEPASDLSAEQQQRLLRLDERRSSLDHYQLLGIERTADAKAIRAAYYELVRIYHPDRYYGKRLGAFEGPLLRVFGKFSEAYEVLHRAESRAEYDRYLAARERTVAFDRYFQDSPRKSIVPAASQRPSSVRPSDPEARRRALARKLGHPSSSRKDSAPSVQLPAATSAERAEEVRLRSEEHMVRAREEQLKHYLELSADASERNDLIAAANMLRIACSLAPDNLKLADDLVVLERRAAETLWESYLERAKYAAAEGSHAEAAECYERAALGQPSAALFERAAHHTLEANGNLRKANKFAKRAVVLAPNSAKCRLALARVYFAANLRESALAELERARAIEPNQPILKEWIARVKRAEPPNAVSAGSDRRSAFSGAFLGLSRKALRR